ncbi:hemerythrin domain-containing protein [Planomonospora sp. ID67723]|uniref:hemerythrin domain-containing protein n=1 Tax=Planomonospora sp. ID67723 TaxID=2738134 RepID=UPI0018C3B7A1|nr:hemerythrin domain-containing protein [Planomonospora sp. ID67723]MBG0831856.1 hemerythrin domain-containing protein [Planomonospora sp. ID67723]
MSSTLDLSAMYVMHDALRREAGHLARVTARVGRDPRSVLRTATGWELFKTALRVHHTAEDEALWPGLREGLADRPTDLVPLEALEAEHGAINEVIEAIDAALANPEAGLDQLSDLIDSLATGVVGHLRHEEDQAVPLVLRLTTRRQWEHFRRIHFRWIRSDTSRILPWLLDGASDQTVATLLAALPEPVRHAYRHRWRPAYTAVDRWSATA